MDMLTKKKTDRFRFLNKLYEVTNGNRLAFVSMWELGTALGLTREETMLTADYLKGEGLLEHMALGGSIGISHYGVREVEMALSKPETETQYFPPVINILNVHSMVGSQIQQGNNGSTQGQTVIMNHAADIHEFVELFKAKLGELPIQPQARAEAEAEIRSIEAQLDSPKPKNGILKECLNSLRTILEGAVSSAVASELLPKLLPILASLAS